MESENIVNTVLFHIFDIDQIYNLMYGTGRYLIGRAE